MTIKGYCQRSISTDDGSMNEMKMMKNLCSRTAGYRKIEIENAQKNYHLKLTQSIIQILHCLPVSIAWLE